MVDSLGGQIHLEMFSANTGAVVENVIERWTINNPIITSVDFGQLSYSNDELVNISIGIK